MRRRWRPLAPLAAALALALPAGAQGTPPRSGGPGVAGAGGPTAVAASTPEAARTMAVEAAEDLTLTRILVGVRLTSAQMERLLPFLESAQKQLRDAEGAAAAALAVPQPRLAETRAALLKGASPSNRAEGQIAEQARSHAAKMRQLRADLVTSLRRTLSSMLAAEQSAALGEAARSVEVGQRTARVVGRAAAGDPGDRGDRGGGPVASMGRVLDRARGVSEAEYGEARLQIAMRLSGMGGGREGRDGGDREPPSLSDPQMQARLGPILALIDRTRQMPDAQYQTNRADLAMQVWSKRAELDGAEVDPAETSEAIDALLDRYFLSPRMIGAMRARMERR